VAALRQSLGNLLPYAGPPGKASKFVEDDEDDMIPSFLDGHIDAPSFTPLNTFG
jgi:hypothetical protein